MKNAILVLLFLLPSILSGNDPMRILFIGNSLTYYNEMPGMVQQMADSEGKEVEVDQLVIGGLSLRVIVSLDATLEKIKEKKWDFIVLQSDDITAFTDMYHIEIDMLNRVKRQIFQNDSSTQIIYEMIWGLENGRMVQGEGYYSYLDYICMIYDGTLYIAQQTDLIISPVGWAWKRARELRPDIRLFTHDEAHPSLRGSYLTACVFYSVLFKERVTGNAYRSSLSDDEALFYQEVASDVVLNSLTIWGEVTRVDDTPEGAVETFYLDNYPNPFNSGTVIRYQVFHEPYELYLSNTLGQRILTLDAGHGAMGNKQVVWDGTDNTGVIMPSGIYFCTLAAGGKRETRRLVLLQ